MYQARAPFPLSLPHIVTTCASAKPQVSELADQGATRT